MDLIRFESKVDKSGECWRWTGVHSYEGYGSVWMGRNAKPRHIYAHRYAFENWVGPIPLGACVLHSCDVRDCVRPDHLRLGTRAENSADMVERDRSRRGAAHPVAKLTGVQVAAIRVLGDVGWRTALIAEAFGVSRSAVELILKGERWAS